MNVERAIEEFMIYTDPYVALSDSCTLKIDHTLRVLKLCELIATNIGLNREDVEIAKMIGLLHDIGRFEQWKRYETFSDGESIDHADLGVEILTTNDYIRNYYSDSKYDNIILSSVEFHNKYSIPNDLSDREKLFLKIIRDADKIDILYLYTIGHIKIDTENNIFNDIVYNNLLNEKSIKRSDKKNKADWLGISLGFIFDINYDISIRILKEKDYLNKEINSYIDKTKNIEFKKQLEEVRKVINNYIEKRLENVR